VRLRKSGGNKHLLSHAQGAESAPGDTETGPNGSKRIGTVHDYRCYYACTHASCTIAQKNCANAEITPERTPMSCECPHRFDTGFIPTADYADDHIIVTRNPPLSRKQETTRRVSDLGGSFIGGGGSREATADEVAEYLARSPHWAHLMRLTLEMGWRDVHPSLAKL